MPYIDRAGLEQRFGIDEISDLLDDDAGGMSLAGKRGELGVRLSMEIAHAWSLGRDVALNPSRYAQT